jgi:cobalt-zinc-cadmium efflux system membrane fusion protein
MINRVFLLPLLLSAAMMLAACAPEPAHGPADGHAEEGAFERGPHGGRLLRNGDFAIEVTLFETGVPPRFHLYATRGGRPVPPSEVTARIELTRLGGVVDTFEFRPEGDYLAGNGIVHEPHSFDVRVVANHGRQSAEWRYASYEGRTTIPAEIAREAGIVAEEAGPAMIRDTLHVMGDVVIDGTRHVRVKARFPGVVRELHVQEGQRVRRGDTLLTVEGNDSLRTYPVIAPIGGVVLARHTSVGEVTDDGPLVELADLSRVWVDLHAFGADAARLRAGQGVHLKSATGEVAAEGSIQRLLPLATAGQGVIARVELPNPHGRWRPGMTVAAEVTLSSRQVPLAVKESALQSFRDSTVVFAQVGDTYEVRMLELGARDGEYAEVLSGLAPGTRYVTGQSYLIRADIEKSGATHEH